MGINVIQAIEKIKCVQEKRKKRLEPDDFINKNWINLKFDKQQSYQTKEVQLETYGHDDENSEDMKRLTEDKSILNYGKDEANQSLFQDVFKPDTTPSLTNTNIKMCSTHAQSSFSDTYFGRLNLFQSISISDEVSSHPHRIRRSLTANSKPFSSNIWRKPERLHWSSAKEFLSVNIKSYKDAVEVVKRKRSDVIVRSEKRKKRKNNEIQVEEMVCLENDDDGTLQLFKSIYLNHLNKFERSLEKY